MTLMIKGLFSSSFALYIVTLYLALLLLVCIQPTIPGLCHYIIYHRVLFKDLNGPDATLRRTYMFIITIISDLMYGNRTYVQYLYSKLSATV